MEKIQNELHIMQQIRQDVTSLNGGDPPGCSLETEVPRSCLEKRRAIGALSKQADRLRARCSEFFTKLLNSRFRERLDGRFEVVVSGIIEDDFPSLMHFYCDYDVYFFPGDYAKYIGLPRTVMPTPTKIDVLEAELCQLYHRESLTRGWSLNHAGIVQVLEHLDSAGMLAIDALIGEAAFWLEGTASHDDEPEWLTLQKARCVVADRIEEMVAAICSNVE